MGDNQHGWMATALNKPFTLRVGDRISAPVDIDKPNGLGTMTIHPTWRVTSIFPHIFIAETSNFAVPLMSRKKCFRKADYVCGIVRRV